MSRRLLSSCTRIMSPVCRRRTPSAPATLGHAVQMSSSSKDDPPQPPKAATKKKPSISKEPEPTVVEKGDTYKAGESYFSYHPYSFYDIENQMQPHRLKQPCSGDKMRIYCQEKLNPYDDKSRRLLPDPWGYLVEWPGKQEPHPRYSVQPVLPIIEGHYRVERDPEKDPYFRARIPL